MMRLFPTQPQRSTPAKAPQSYRDDERIFRPRYGVDVLKVEVPVNMNYVEGYATSEVVHTKAEAAKFFKEQAEATNLPFIFLSAGVKAELFKKHFALRKSGFHL